MKIEKQFARTRRIMKVNPRFVDVGLELRYLFRIATNNCAACRTRLAA